MLKQNSFKCFYVLASRLYLIIGQAVQINLTKTGNLNGSSGNCGRLILLATLTDTLSKFDLVGTYRLPEIPNKIYYEANNQR